MLKKIGFWIGVLSLSYLFLVGAQYASIAFLGDYSLQPVHEPDSAPSQPRPPVYLMSYADGPVYYLQNQNAMAASALNKGIDFILNYRRPHLEEAFLKKNHKIFKKHGPNGLWLWKPYLIYRQLQSLPEGAYLIYLDSNFIFRKPITPLLKNLETHDIILTEAFGVPQKLGQYTKGDVLEKLGCASEACRHLPLFAGGAFFIKNNARSRAFFKEWLDLCEQESLLDNGPSVFPNFPEFLFHFHEGALLSTLYHVRKPPAVLLKMKNLYEYLYWAHRKAGKRKIKAYYTLYGVRKAYLRVSGSALTSVSLLNFPPLVWLRKWVYGLIF